MKKKLFLAIIMATVLVLVLAFAVSADSVHNENTVDYGATVTLDDGAVLRLYDENKEALIWYIDGTDEGGKTKYSSVRADDSNRVKWKAESWDEVRSWDALLEDGKTSIKSKIVVINLMDDDVVRNTGAANYLDKPMNVFKQLFGDMKKLEYCYLRLDTKAINTNSFSGCTKLKYINLENLTQLQRMAQNSQFSGCTRLFDGQVLDLTRTQLYEFEGSSTFSGVPFKGVKFPETMVKIGSTTTFNNCTKLEFVSVGTKAKFYGTPFSGCTSLKAIYYVGTEDDLSASTIGNVVEDAMIKSYADYKVLSDKSGVHIVYDYSWCEAFNQGVHGTINVTNTCVGVCSVCDEKVVNHVDGNTGITITYSNYAEEGTKTIACQNDGCTYNVTEETPALFTCLGYSVAEYANGISVGYAANNKAMDEYRELTGKTLSYGVFAVLQSKLGKDEIFDKDGNKGNGVVNADLTSRRFDIFEFKIIGFADDKKDTKLALGAYISVTGENGTEYSYLQIGTKAENEKYVFVTYNEVTK